MCESSPQTKLSVLSLSFNQDFECFVAGCDDGFRIFNANPLKEIERCELGGGVAVAEMLFRSNYLALVGGGNRPAFPPNRLIIWDCSVGKAVIELEAESRLLAVRLRRDSIVAVEEHSLTVHSFSDIPHQLHKWRSWPNPKGLCALASSDEHPLVAFPSSSGAGAVSVERIGSGRDADTSPATVTFRAHSHGLQALTFNYYGTMVATASEKGTLVRLFHAVRGTLLREFRRGSNAARISCINFSLDSKLLSVSSNHSTIHVFAMQKPPIVVNKGLPLRRLERYIKGDVSFSRLRVAKPKAAADKNKPTGDVGPPPRDRATDGSNEEELGTDASCGALENGLITGINQCAFDRDCESIIVLAGDGSHYNFQFNKANGACKQRAYRLFTELHSGK